MRGIATEAERNLPIVCPTGGGSETLPVLAQNNTGAYSGVSLLLGSCFFFQEIVPEDMGVTRVSGGRARASRDADKVHFLLCRSLIRPAGEPQPELAESPPCNSLSLIPHAFSQERPFLTMGGLSESAIVSVPFKSRHNNSEKKRSTQISNALSLTLG